MSRGAEDPVVEALRDRVISRGPALLLFVLACSSETVRIYAPPPAGGAGTLLLLVEAEGAVEAHVAEAGAGAVHFEPRASLRPDEAAVWAVRFDATLTELGLEAGPFESYDGPAAARGFPPSAERWRLALEPGAAWSPSDLDPTSLRELRLPPEPLGCARLGMTASLLPGTNRPSFFVEDGATRVLTAIDGQAYAVSIEGEAQPVATDPPGLGLKVAARVGGALWVGLEDRTIRSAELSGGVLRLGPARTPSVAASFRGLAVSGPGEPFEVFVALQDSTFLRFDDAGGWTRLHEWGPPFEDTAEVVRLGPGRAASSRYVSPEVAIWEAGVLRVEAPDPGYAVTTLAFIEPYGLLAGTSSGLVLRREAPSAWRPVTNIFGEATGGVTHSLTHYPGGFVAGGSLGRVVQILGSQRCEPVLLSRRGVRSLMPLGDGLVAGLDNTDPALEMIFVLRALR